MSDSPINFGATNDAIEQYKSDVNAGIVPDAQAPAFYAQNPSPMPVQTPEIMKPSVDALGNVIPPMVPDIQKPMVAPAPPPVDVSQYAPKPQAPAAPAVPDNTSKLFENSIAQQQAANNNIAKAVADKAVAEDAAFETQQARLEVQQQKQLQEQKQFDETYNTKLRALDDLSTKLGSQEFTESKIDQGRFWNSRSTGQKVLGGIAVLLGGLAQGLGGGDNRALVNIHKFIDNDIEEQKANFNRKAAGLKDQMEAGRSVLGELRQKFNSDSQAETAFRLLANDMVQNKIKQLTARVDNTVVQQNARALNAKLDQEKQALLSSLKMQNALQQKIVNGGSSADLSPMEIASLPKELKEAYESDRERSVPGFIGRAPTKEVAGKLIEQAVPIQQAIEGANSILSMSKDLNRVTDLKKKAQIATEVKALAGQLRVPLTGPGALTEKEYDRLMDIVGDPTSLSSMPALQRARLEQVQKKLNRDLDVLAEGHGLRRSPKVTVPMRPYEGK
jgi:hypothetical protein